MNNYQHLEKDTYKDIINGRKVKTGNPLNKKEWNKYEVDMWMSDLEE